MTVPPVLVSVNVGLPKNVAWQGSTGQRGKAAQRVRQGQLPAWTRLYRRLHECVLVSGAVQRPKHGG